MQIWTGKLSEILLFVIARFPFQTNPIFYFQSERFDSCFSTRALKALITIEIFQTSKL